MFNFFFRNRFKNKNAKHVLEKESGRESDRLFEADVEAMLAKESTVPGKEAEFAEDYGISSEDPTPYHNTSGYTMIAPPDEEGESTMDYQSS